MHLGPDLVSHVQILLSLALAVGILLLMTLILLFTKSTYAYDLSLLLGSRTSTAIGKAICYVMHSVLEVKLGRLIFLSLYGIV